MMGGVCHFLFTLGSIAATSTLHTHDKFLRGRGSVNCNQLSKNDFSLFKINTMNVQTFQFPDAVLRQFAQTGRQFGRTADLFDGVQKTINSIREARQLDETATADFYQMYLLTQTWNYRHDPAAGKVLASEVQKLMAAKVKVAYKDTPEPFLKMTPPIQAKMEEVNAWFTE